MRIAFIRSARNKTGTNVLNRKLSPEHVLSEGKVGTRRRVRIKQTGRLVDVFFPIQSDVITEKMGHLQLAESELLMLANLCRRGRSDQEFLQAITKAGATSVMRPSRKPSSSLPLAFAELEDEYGFDV